MADYNKRKNEDDRGGREERGFQGRRQTRFLDPNALVDVNDVELMRRFVTEYGKIVPARLTGVNAKQQRQIKRGIKRARNLGLLA